MLSNCICIVAPLSRHWQTKTESRTPIVGVLTRPAGRKPRPGGGTMDLESPPRTGAFPQTLAAAHDRVCSCSSTAIATHGSFLRVCSSRGGLHMESGSLLGPRFHAPTRRDAPLSSKPGASCSRAAPGNRWQPTRGLRSQHPQLSSLPAARTMPVEWQRRCQATPGECAVASAPGGFCPAAASRDWSRREHRRACIQLVRHQRIEMSLSPSAAASPPTAEVILSRAKRAHARLCWQERLARNARPEASGQVTITLFGVPDAFATLLGLRAP